MTFYDWIPGISTSALLGFALWLSRSLILTRLTKSVQHEFDEKIEGVRTELRKSEELYKADLRSKESQIEALRSGAMTGFASRQATLDRRRIKAAEQLWAAVISLSPVKSLPSALAAINFDAASKESATNSKLLEMFSVIGSAYNYKELLAYNAGNVRPFISPISWALYSAYHAIISHAIVKLEMLKAGLDDPKIIQWNYLPDLIKTVLPHHTEYINEHGDSVSHFLLDELESRLLEEIQKMLQGIEADRASIAQAAEILKESNKVMGSIAQSAQV